MYKMSYEGIGAVVATCEVLEDCSGGEMVKLLYGGCVGHCSEGDLFCGMLLNPRSDWAGVQVKGFMKVKYSGVLNPGQAQLVADGDGGVKAADSGVSALVMAVYGDSTADICL